MDVRLLNFQDCKWTLTGEKQSGHPDLVLIFISPDLSDMTAMFEQLRQKFPNSNVVGCSTGGEVFKNEVNSGTIVCAALYFEDTKIKVSKVMQARQEFSFQSGKVIASELQADDLSGILIISDGLTVNGSKLVAGIREVIGEDCPIAGALAGDGSDFGQTFVGANAPMVTGQISAIGFYGDKFRLHSGCYDGWNEFGPKRVVTRSKGNILYELDGKPALDLYKKYLGEEAKDLPGSALIYPLKIFPSEDSAHGLIRTVVGIDEEKKSLTFAGEIPEGCKASLMIGHRQMLIEGAGKAAENITVRNPEKSLSLLISCIGRRLVLGEQTYQEVEEVHNVLGAMPQIGFYSYGEISPHRSTGVCDLHNQTMTVAVLEECI